MNGFYSFASNRPLKSWRFPRILSFILLSLVLLSCAAPSKFLGTRQPRFVNNACPIESEFCTIGASKNDWRITGTYYLNRTDAGSYHLRGMVKLDVTEVSSVFQSISKLDLTFVFLQGDLVVHEEKVRLRGEVNEYIEFSHFFDTDNSFASSAWAWWDARITELPATGTASKSKLLFDKKTYIRIESDEQIYENGQLKFTVKSGDILEVIRVKTCISGSGTCWQVRSTRTGETGFRRADVLKQRHTVYENEPPESADRIAISGNQLSTNQTSTSNNPNISGTYVSKIKSNVPYWFQTKQDRELIVTLKQEGNKITGKAGSTDSEITGKIEGDTIKFAFWSSGPTDGSSLRGIWTIFDGGSTMKGVWAYGGGSSGGTWDLTKVE